MTLNTVKDQAAGGRLTLFILGLKNNKRLNMREKKEAEQVEEKEEEKGA